MSCGCIGGRHTAVVDSAGTVWTIGEARHGQLGHEHVHSATPQRVEGLPHCILVSAGDQFTACLSQDGEVFCFGENQHGQLGQGHTNDLRTPHRVAGLPPILSLSCGFSVVMCVARDNSVWSFGQNDMGQLGLSPAAQSVTTPTRVEGVRASQVACGWKHSLILGTDGKVYGCGSGERGQLGFDVASVTHPVPLPFDGGVLSVHCGDHFSVIRAADGTLWSAGDNTLSQLGLGNPNVSRRDRFTQVSSTLVSTQVSCGSHHTLVINDQNQLWGWGGNQSNQLGHGPNRLSIPTLLRCDTRVALAGCFHTFIRTTDDEVLSCGENSHYQLAIGLFSRQASWTPSILPPDTIRVFDDDYIDWRGPLLNLSAEEEYQLEELHRSTLRLQRLVDLAGASPTSTGVPPAPLCLNSWQWCNDMLAQKVETGQNNITEQQNKLTAFQAVVGQSRLTLATLQEQVAQEEARLKTLEEEERSMACQLAVDHRRLAMLQDILAQCKNYAAAEEQQHNALDRLLQQRALHTLEANEMDLVWWRSQLDPHSVDGLKRCGIPGAIAINMDASQWRAMGMSRQDACRIKFTLDMLNQPGGLEALRQLSQEDCAVCMSCSTWTTSNLLAERGITLAKEMKAEGWITPWLIYAEMSQNDLDYESDEECTSLMDTVRELKKIHANHLFQFTEGDEHSC